jgi:hypothetical protein
MERQSVPPRYFTLDEANRVLPRVRDLIERLQRLAAEVDALNRAFQNGGQPGAASPSANGNGVHHNGSGQNAYSALTRAEAARAEMRRLLEELESIGCEFKDVHTGLVDFRSMRDGRAVYLCWRLGEERIAFWHELDAGYAGRQPL